MPNYQAPGVYVEDTDFRAHSIEGVTTNTAAFVGPTRRGPVGVAPELLHSLSDFERLYGGPEDLELADIDDAARRLNFVAHSVRAFFENGGARLYVARTARGAAVAEGVLRDADHEADRIALRARFAGAACNGHVLLREVSVPGTGSALDAAPPGSLLSIIDAAGAETLYVGSGSQWAAASGLPLSLDERAADATPGGAGAVASLLTLNVEASTLDGPAVTWSRLGLAPAHPRWLGAVLGDQPSGLLQAKIGSAVDAFALLAAVRALPLLEAADPAGRRVLALTGGSDGQAPWAGDEATPGSYAAALAMLRDIDGISTVAAPGSSALPDGAAIRRALVAHAERPSAWCMALLDSAPGQTPSEVRELCAEIESSRAALYYPWVVTVSARNGPTAEIALPPAGFVAGIYARSDVERGVHKAPANEVVRGALRFERNLQALEIEVLNPLGVNCLRFLAGRGLRVWGARTASASDPDWKYVPQRRFMNYIEASIDRGTRWAVFEPNTERLWAAVRRAVSDFLLNEWRKGALLGATPDDAFFVRCDRSTMTQNDIDNGRLVAMVGVAMLWPSEFVIGRIGQWTADRGPS